MTIEKLQTIKNNYTSEEFGKYSVKCHYEK